MRLPLLIFMVSGIATMQLEPIATGGVEALLRYARARMDTGRIPGRAASANTNERSQTNDQIRCLQAELADVEMDLMKVFATDRAMTSRLEKQEEILKYALRAAQIRRDESVQCLSKKPAFLALNRRPENRCAAVPEKPRS
jgi:hypothetical protein